MEFPEALLDAFKRTTGLRVKSLQDRHGDIWWAEDDKPDMFRCSVGDRVMHIDELADGKSNDE
jgi:hypothetical protein